MVFSTIIFLCAFLPITIIGYYIMPGRGKNAFLLLMSLLFYAWGEPTFVLVMLFSILCNYAFGMVLANCKKRYQKPWVILAIITNLSILGIFKYTGFVVSTLSGVMPGLLQIPKIALPIGISFYTFQGLSYCIDVYRDKSIVQKNPINLALYISMFPQLIAGPIVRYTDVAPHLNKRTHSPELFAQGAERFIIGLAKKAIFANTMGALADSIMGSDFNSMSIGVAWLGAIAYSLQIYFDFSGYSDMAIGLGKIFGFHFMENFNYPYISKSIREFWRRWHISLSSWFRDYLYIPMGGSRRGNVYFNLLVVFLATGLWHGADWGFVLWGLWHGFFMILERIFGKEKKTSEDRKISMGSIVKAFIGHIYTLLVVIVGWVLFKLVDLQATFKYLKVMFGMNQTEYIAYSPLYYLDNKTLFILVCALLACVPWKTMFGKKFEIREREAEGNRMGASLAVLCIKRAGLLLLLVLCFVFIITSTYNPFIYFRF